MLFKGTDVEDRLHQLRERQKKGDQILEEVREFLRKDFQRENRIIDGLASGNSCIANDFEFDLMETDRIYHIDTIKSICIDYRLRFLDTSYFKGKIPRTALEKIKALEAAHNIEIRGYKIMAPSKLFKLENMDDPLLFAPIGNDHYYLIHKWGKDLHPFRRMLAWPFKNIGNLALVVIALSYLVALMVPDGLFSKNSSTAEFLIIFFFMFKCMASVVIFYGFALGKNFNPAIWNSKHYNS